MNRKLDRSLARLTLLAALCTATGAQAQANIDQTRAVNGGINASDAPGFPVTLTQAGHYRLTGNLVVPAGSSGIVIEGHNITLDLNGFTISGPANCSRNTSTRAVTCGNMPSTLTFGVTTSQGAQGVTVRNGGVRGFSRGIRLLGHSRIEGVVATHNFHGLEIYAASGSHGGAGVMADSSAELNGGTGLYVDRGQIFRSSSSRNGWYGVSAPTVGSVQVFDSVASGNAREGFVGASLRGTLATDNGQVNRSKVQSLGQNVDEQGKF